MDATVVEREACRQGWDGVGSYDYTRYDLEAVISAIGRKPTAEEWRAAGLRYVGDVHVADEE